MSLAIERAMGELSMAISEILSAIVDTGADSRALYAAAQHLGCANEILAQGMEAQRGETALAGSTGEAGDSPATEGRAP